MKKVARLRVAQDEFMPSNKTAVEPNVSVRTTGRIKKPKAVFDPSDNYVPRAQRVTQANTPQQHVTPPKAAIASSPTAVVTREKQRENTGNNLSSPQETDICFICQKREPRRGGNYRNKLLTCITCALKVHRLCESTDFLETAPVRQKYKCESCRICNVCENKDGKGEIVLCAKCLTSFHMVCHTPKVTKLNQRNWKCFKCLPNATSLTGVSNSNAGKADSMPVTVIRQIIGYDANVEPLLKNQNTEPVVVQQAQKLELVSKEAENEEQVETEQSPPKPQAEAPAKTQANITSRNHLASSSSSPSSENDVSNNNDDDDDDDDDDEDYHYVEKKKRRLLPDSNNSVNNNGNNKNDTDINSANGNGNHGNGKNGGFDLENHVAINLETEEKPIANNLTSTIDDLPKREVIRTWSVEKLTNYVQKYFPNEAQVFKEHEIDGNALLLLKRSDVVKKLPLKLGPSLRLYNFILKIQTQKLNDPTLGWDCSIDTLLPSTE